MRGDLLMQPCVGTAGPRIVRVAGSIGVVGLVTGQLG